MHEPSFRLKDLVIDLASGEVRRPDGSVERLQPQPASLLGLLVENAGDVVDRECIREHLWGDQELEFESSLHYCVRQVRSALGESASEPVFVETLARRGYRLKVRPEPIEDDGIESAAVRALSPGAARAAVGVLGILLLAVFGLALTAAPPVVQRLAILPFEPPAGWADDTRTESVPELLLLRLGQDPSSLVVLGPTSTAGRTAGLSADGPALADLVAALDVQWAINGRYIEAGDRLPGDGRGVLVELIRTSDGAHVWVAAYPLDADPEAVASDVAPAVSTRLVR